MRENLNILEKTQKSVEIFRSNRKRNCRNQTTSYKIKFIDSARFMAISSLKLVDNITEGIPKIQCKDCDCFLEYESVKDNLINI